MSGLRSWWSFVDDRWGEVWTLVQQHAWLVIESILFATIIAVGLGIWSHRNARVKPIVLAIASVFLTIPSLALFVIFIPFVGLGRTGPLIALTMYSILPVLRNTTVGLEQVDPAVVEAAKGVGMSSTTRLFRVELPLALPVIFAGVRVATLLNTGIAAIATLVQGGGLGDFIKDGLARYPLPGGIERIWAGVVFTVLLALVLDTVISLVARFTTPRGSTAR